MPEVSTRSAAQMPPGTKVLDRLVQEARLSPDQYQSALTHARRVSIHCEDAVVDLGFMSEGDLLKYLAGIYRTRFVSTAKLAKASIDATMVRLVPRKVCQRLHTFPIMLDKRTQVLSVVAADLETHDVEKQVQLVSGAREVRVYVARPAAIDALIRKHWDGDPAAFSAIRARAQSSPPPAPSAGAAALPATDPADYYDDPSIGSGLFDLATAEEITTGSALAPQPPPKPRRAAPRRPVSLTIEAPDIAAELARGVAEPAQSAGSEDYLETLNVLVALLERDRGDLRGHSAQVARLSRKLCERIGLSSSQMHGILVAAYLHDIGKTSSYHLTALNVAQYEGHRLVAQKSYLTPVRMFETANLPAAATEAITHLYERFDGQGFPDRQSGKEVPIASRIVAIVETYLDLTSHAKNPFRKKLDARQGCAALAKHRGTVFDPNLVDLFQTVVLGDDLQKKLLADRPTVLVVDPDPEETTVLELRLIEHGFEVVIARNANDALAHINQGGIDALISEVELKPIDGFALLDEVRRSSKVPVLFLTRRSDRETVSRGFEAGAADFLVKPASADVVAAKTQQILGAQRPANRGVSGQLSEMSLPDVVQVLSNGRKSGRLRLESGGHTGEIDFSDGAIWDARFGDRRGEEAFYAMLLLVEGEFTLDPDGRPSARHIDAPTESLLLEGMRRLDEGRR